MRPTCRRSHSSAFFFKAMNAIPTTVYGAGAGIRALRETLIAASPPGISDKDYLIAQYDGSIAYMDAAIQSIFTALEAPVSSTKRSWPSTATRRDALRT